MFTIDSEAVFDSDGVSTVTGAAAGAVARLDPLAWLSRITTVAGVRDIANFALAGEGPHTERVAGLGCADGLAGGDAHDDTDGNAVRRQAGDSLAGCDTLTCDTHDAVTRLIRQATRSGARERGIGMVELA